MTKKTLADDPHLKREQEKYENPIASREYLLSLINDETNGLSLVEVCYKLSIVDEAKRIAVQRRLRAMEREGQVYFDKFKRYKAVDESMLVSGVVLGHRDGFGFLKRDDNQPDLFLSAKQMQLCLPNDRVTARIKEGAKKGKLEAGIVTISEPRSAPIVGRYYFDGGVGVVVPDDTAICHEFIIPPENTLGARHGNMVVMSIEQRPMKRMNPVGKVTEILGEHMAPGMEIEIALRNFEIPHKWPEGILESLDKLAEEVPDSAKKGRVDLRAVPLVTIDGEDARDFDDAVFCRQDDDGNWRLWVAIADVSYYVRPESKLDNHAISRGNSVYFPQQVIPMLPEKLSNGLCSLNPHVDRLCMVCEMNISPDGELISHEFYEAVMHSHARLTYNKVWGILQGDPDLYKANESLVPHLRDLYSLYKILRKKRDARGAIAFDTIESQFLFNSHRKIDAIVPVERNDAHRLIEECMILANVAAATSIEAAEIDGLFRIHPEPDSERLKTLLGYLSEVGVRHQINENSQPHHYSHVMNKISQRADKELIQSMLLRSMKQATYDPENVGHFGLALPRYTHFTSPIRRYPDLVVHRILKHLTSVKAGKPSKTGGYYYELPDLDGLGEQCSMTERRADDATRDVADWLKCEFMQDHVGDTFEGIISSVTGFGFFVRLCDFHIDGLVHITALGNEYHVFNELKQTIVGERSGITYRLGDRLKIKVVAVNLDERKIDFCLAEVPKQKRVSRTTKSRADGSVAQPPANRKTKKSTKARVKKSKRSKR